MKKTENKAGNQVQTATPAPPRGWKFYRNQCEQFSEKGEIEKLEVAFEAMKNANPPSEFLFRWQIRISVIQGDYPSAIMCLQEIWEKELPYKPEIAVPKLIEFYGKLKDPEVILDCARHAMSHAPSFIPPVPILVAAVEETADLDSAMDLLVALYLRHKDCKPLLHKIFKIMNMTNPGQLTQFVRDNLDDLDELDLGKFGLSGRSVIASTPRLFDNYRTVNVEEYKTDDEKVRAAKFHIEQENLEKARLILSSIPPKNMPEEGEFLTKLIDDMPGADSLTRPELSEDISDYEVIIAETPDAVGTVIVFCGLADQSMMPTKFLDKYFSALRLSAVYLRDQQRYLYLKGIPELGKDLQETMSELENILKRLQTKRIFTFGTSAGGYGAIRYGLMLNAEAIICFSTVTCIHPDEPRAKLLQKRILQICSLDEFDLRLNFQKYENSSTRVFMYYGDQMQQDRIQAEMLASVRNVTLHPVSGYKGHQSLARVVCEKGLFPTIADHYQIKV